MPRHFLRQLEVKATAEREHFPAWGWNVWPSGWLGCEESLNASLNMPLTAWAAALLTELSCGGKWSWRGFSPQVHSARRGDEFLQLWETSLHCSPCLLLRLQPCLTALLSSCCLSSPSFSSDSRLYQVRLWANTCLSVCLYSSTCLPSISPPQPAATRCFLQKVEVCCSPSHWKHDHCSVCNDSHAASIIITAMECLFEELSNCLPPFFHAIYKVWVCFKRSCRAPLALPQ